MNRLSDVAGRLAGLLTLAALLLSSGCATLPPPVATAATYAIEDFDQTTLGKLAAEGAPAPTKDALAMSGFRLLPEASFAFDARLAIVRSAEKSLDVQYYVFQCDDVGLVLLRELRNAARRGVRVRLLLDDLHVSADDAIFRAFGAFENVEVRLFNPIPVRGRSLAARLLLSLADFKRINHRMHNKLLLADNSIAITGGRNIGNEYFMRSASANFIDMDVLSSGPIVRDMSTGFDRYWNSTQVRPFTNLVPPSMPAEMARMFFDDAARSAAMDNPPPVRDVLNHSSVGEQLAAGQLERHWAHARWHVDDPDKIVSDPDEAFRGSVNEGALAMIGSARKSVRVGSPYFIPGPIGMDLMRRLIDSGRSIVVTTNSLGATDEPLAYAGYERYRTDMLKIGVVIYEIAPTSKRPTSRFGNFGKSISRLHGKLAVVDDERIFVGSMNLDYRSGAVNTELGLEIESPPLVAEYNRFIGSANLDLGYRLRLSDDGRRTQWVERGDDGEVVHHDVPGRWLWLRFKNWLLLPIVGEGLQ